MGVTVGASERDSRTRLAEWPSGVSVLCQLPSLEPLSKFDETRRPRLFAKLTKRLAGAGALLDASVSFGPERSVDKCRQIRCPGLLRVQRLRNPGWAANLLVLNDLLLNGGTRQFEMMTVIIAREQSCMTM